jgi:hypothetical protein
MKKFMVAAVFYIAAFLIGFVPQYVKAKRLENDGIQLSLRVGQEIELDDLRDLAALAYVQASQKNYGLAGQTCSQFFEHAAETLDRASDQRNRKALESLLAMRDNITAELAKGDPGVLNDLQDLFLKTRQMTIGGWHHNIRDLPGSFPKGRQATTS